ncbi:MAG: S41 family peptidase [Terrimicrobiaceae bacterium]|nr:S41 family peptidase [Terrimicrobiaceae bacterium]
MKRVWIWILAAAIAHPLAAQESGEAAESPYDQMQILARAMQLIRQDYVDESKVDFESLTRSALRGMLAELDPHSQYMEPSDFKSMQEDTRSEFGGLGVVVGLKNGVLTIINPMEDTPGFEAGLMPGDQILKINGQSTEKYSLPEAVEKLRGPAGEKVSLTVHRPATKEVKDYDLTRVVIKVPSVKDAQILPTEEGDPRIGYVRITQFNEPTVTELNRALDKLEKQGMQALVLDLRYNPGGLLGSAVEVCGQFLPPNTLVVSTEGRTPSREYRTPERSGARRDYPVVVLVNYASASGSEIVAGALKDLNRALLVGETTFGKGSVQSVISLPDGSAVRLTTAKYFTPGKNMIHEHGVSPHLVSTLSFEEESELLRARRRSEDSSKTPPVQIDPQLARAIDALRGTLLFSGARPTTPPKS